MPLSITHTWPKIGIETQNAKLNLSNNGIIGLKISHTEPQVQIESTQPKLHIDQTKAFGDEGLKTIQDLMDQFVQDGRQAALKYTAKMVDEGERLGRIEDGGNAIAEIARDSTFDKREYSLGVIPEHPPEIRVEPGEVHTDVIKGEVNVQFNQVPIEQDYIPPQIKIYLMQKGELNIDFTGNNVDTKV